MDPNAKLATICKDGHKRIWHTADKCPMCGAIAYGRKREEIKERWKARYQEQVYLVERLKKELES